MRKLSDIELEDLADYCNSRWKKYPKNIKVDRKEIVKNFRRLLYHIKRQQQDIEFLLEENERLKKD